MSEKAKVKDKERNNATLSKISNAIKGSEKLDVEGTDLLELLSHLEGELQARDIAIAALKSEQLKRVLYGLHRVVANSSEKTSGDPSTHLELPCPLSALQRDKFHSADANSIEESVQVSASNAEIEIVALQEVIEKQRNAASTISNCLRQSEFQRLEALKELEAERQRLHQIQSSGDDSTDGAAGASNVALNYELEQERNRYKQDYEKELLEKQKLEAALKDVTANYEEEKSKQKQIVLVLLSDRKKLHKLYREEKKRSEDLAQMLQEEKGKMDTMAVGLEEESKRSLAMEAELEKHLCQFGSERQQLREKLLADERKFRDMEEALRKARLDAEHFKKQLSEAHRVAMSQASPPPPYPGAANLLITATTSAPPTQPVSPTPLSAMNRQPVSQAYPSATYSIYSGVVGSTNAASTVNSSVGGVVGGSNNNSGYPYNTQSGSGGYPMTQGYTPLTAGGTTIPRTTNATGSVITSRATQGNPVVRSVTGHGGSVAPAATSNDTATSSGGGANQTKYHQQNYNNAGGFGGVSHPAMMPTTGPLSHLDQDLIPSDIYSQIVKPVGSNNISGKSSSNTSTVNRKALDSSSTPTSTSGVIAANRKPGLGKGVPPPVPPNKPAVGPAKKDSASGSIGKRDAKETLGLTLEAGKQSMVTGLQGLKFGISIGGGGGAGSSDGGKLKTDGSAQPSGGPLSTKKFFSNIESKS